VSVYLHGLAVKNFRGIDDEWQEVLGLTQFNFFIGPNNAGKSTILDLVDRYFPLPHKHRSHNKDLTLDLHRGAKAGQFAIRVAVPIEPIKRAIEEKLPQHSDSYAVIAQAIDSVATDKLFILQGTSPFTQNLEWIGPTSVKDALLKIPRHDLQVAWSALTGRGMGDPRIWAEEIAEVIMTSIDYYLPPIHLIPAFRRILLESKPGEISGSGLIEDLAKLQAPALDSYEKDRANFDKINAFVREVTHRPEARIEVPHERNHILVHMDGRILPLESLGTGIQQVIMLAAYCTIHDESIICLEEPELHLHPLLQRRLMDYLAGNTRNQYLIATHSAAFIDQKDATIFRVWQQDNVTRIRRAASRQQRHEICGDLGYRASDILQSNAVIWVEGPSDRIYINHWLAQVAPELEESLHYSIMFYGGRLLSHLTANDEITEFIKLRDLNRNLAIVIDSDRKAAGNDINATKQRVIKEIGSTGFAWLTGGREIENYIPHKRLQEAVSQTVGQYDRPAAGGMYDHALYYYSTPAGADDALNPDAESAEPEAAAGEEALADETDTEASGAKKKKKKPNEPRTDVDKVRVARLVCKHDADLAVLDLEARVKELAAFIKAANGLGVEENPA
jgi:predicted ATPase